MKTKSVLLSVVFVAASITSVLAESLNKELTSTAAISVIPAKNVGVFKVVYTASEAGKVKLTVYNASGELMHTENFKHKGGFILPVNLSQLKDGEYSIVIEDQFGKQIEKVNLNRMELSAVKSVQVIKAADANAKYLLMIPKQETACYTLKIFNDKNELLHNSKLDLDGDYAGMYDLSKSRSSSYTFVLSTKNGQITSITK
jgi:hypothetical protein